MKACTVWGKFITAALAAVSAMILCFTLLASGSAARADGVVGQETVVACDPADPYYPLAEKIARADGLEMAGDFLGAMKLQPRLIILVASPENLSGELLLTIGRTFQSLGSYPALGIITGSTMEKAEQLWARRDLARQGRNYLGGDIEVTQRVSGPIIYNISSDALEEDIELTKDNLIEVLKEADTFYWSRHVGGRTWFWNSESKDFDENDELRAAEIPPLGPVVIYTPSCNSLRPWLDDSIALAFIDQGAAAYLGDTNSPFTNAFIKRGLAVPGISSWEEFPLGLVAQVHSKMMTRALFTQPQFFMLGDPRISLTKEPPYQVISDAVKENGKRVITGQSDFAGVLAVKIADGARYDFLAVKEVTAASEHDLFFNSKLQTMNLGADKYALLLHAGGPFEIELSPKAPLGWVVGDAFIDALDYAWVLLRLDEKIIFSRYLYLVPAAVLALMLGYKGIRQKRSLVDYRGAFLCGLLIASMRMGYGLLRADAYTVSANFVDYYTAELIGLGFVGEFASFSLGLILMQDARKARGRLLGLVVAVFPPLLLAGFYLGFITLMNVVTPMTGMSAPWLLNYSLFWMLFAVLLVEMGLVLIAFRVVTARRR